MRLIHPAYEYYKDFDADFVDVDGWEEGPLTFWEQIAYYKYEYDESLEYIDERLMENVQEMLRKLYDELSDEEKKILDDNNHGDGFSYVMQTFNYRLREIYLSDRVQAFIKYQEETWK